MSLTKSQLLILDTLSYTDCVEDGMTVGNIIDTIEASDYNISGIESSSEIRTAVANVKNDEAFLNYRVTNTRVQSGGMKAVCFVDNISDPKDVNVSFRGLADDFEFSEAGPGTIVNKNIIQTEAVEYINSLPAGYGKVLTVTGHASGGNIAQYATLMSDRVGSCVTFEEHGFSPEFVEENKEKVNKNKEKMTSVSAGNCIMGALLVSVAGTVVYLETKKQSNFLDYLRPSVLFGENGGLNKPTPEGTFPLIIKDFNNKILTDMGTPERDIIFDGLLSFATGGDNNEIDSLQQVLLNTGETPEIEGIALNYVGEVKGFSSTDIATRIASVLFPVLFVNTYINALKNNNKISVSKALAFANRLVSKIVKINPCKTEFYINLIKFFDSQVSKTDMYFANGFSQGYTGYSSAELQINTAIMYSFAERLLAVQKRLYALDVRIKNLYNTSGLNDLATVSKLGMIDGDCWKIRKYAEYCSGTASDFENAERIISSKI